VLPGVFTPGLTANSPFADDKFREKFLWGRRPMLAACAARLRDRSNLVWVDLGGGTGVSGLVGAFRAFPDVQQCNLKPTEL